MITPSHLIYSWAVAKASKSEPDRPRTLAFLVGALIPDTPVYLFFFINGLILGYGHEKLWDDMYFNSGWSIAFTVSHSLLFWPLLLAVGVYCKKKIIQYISMSALLHITVDFLVHTDDAYKHFWPLTDWRFISPVSYWNRAEYGQYIGVLDSVIVLGLLAYLATRYHTLPWRIGLSAIGMLYIARLIAEVLIV